MYILLGFGLEIYGDPVPLVVEPNPIGKSVDQQVSPSLFSLECLNASSIRRSSASLSVETSPKQENRTIRGIRESGCSLLALEQTMGASKQPSTN